MTSNTNGLLVKKRVIECLEQDPQRVFSTKEIATWIFENYEDASRAIKKDSPPKAVIQEVMARISGDRLSIEKSSKVIIRKINGKLSFSYNDSDDNAENEQADNNLPTFDKTHLSNATTPASENKRDVTTLSEEELYPILWEYLQLAYPTVYAKHINDKESRKNEGANAHQWRHPDLVGVERQGGDWGDDIRTCVDAYSGEKPKLRLWSFEVKKEIRKGESREYFFQAVSNSTWANYGYLVARKIHKNALDDLFILSGLHGIGLIELNVDTPSNSRVLIPAKERVEVDWNTADTLVKINPNFKKYIQNIRRFYQTNEWDDEYWSRMKEPK